MTRQDFDRFPAHGHEVLAKHGAFFVFAEPDCFLMITNPARYPSTQTAMNGRWHRLSRTATLDDMLQRARTKIGSPPVGTYDLPGGWWHEPNTGDHPYPERYCHLYASRIEDIPPKAGVLVPLDVDISAAMEQMIEQEDRAIMARVYFRWERIADNKSNFAAWTGMWVEFDDPNDTVLFRLHSAPAPSP